MSAPPPKYKFEPDGDDMGATVWRLRRVSTWPEYAVQQFEYEWFAECAEEDAEFVCAALNAAHKRHVESEIG